MKLEMELSRNGNPGFMILESEIDVEDDGFRLHVSSDLMPSRIFRLVPSLEHGRWVWNHEDGTRIMEGRREQVAWTVASELLDEATGSAPCNEAFFETVSFITSHMR